MWIAQILIEVAGIWWDRESGAVQRIAKWAASD